VESVSADTIVGTGLIAADHPLASNGLAPAALAIELGAQAAAAFESIGRQVAGGDPADFGARAGSLVRVREARFQRGDLPTSTRLLVTARLQGAAPPLAIYQIAVWLGEAPLVESIISTHSGSTAGAA
jgi:predicted hotdog family 3-hydroxylacyl-ACP dehydratase